MKGFIFISGLFVFRAAHYEIIFPARQTLPFIARRGGTPTELEKTTGKNFQSREITGTGMGRKDRGPLFVDLVNFFQTEAVFLFVLNVGFSLLQPILRLAGNLRI